MPGPVSRTDYAGACYSMTESPVIALGSSWCGLVVDWLHDWVMGKPAISNNRLVAPVGDFIELE
jgi:hypothetical protein